MTESAPPSVTDPPRDRLVSVAMDDWTVLGGPLRLDVGEERTVLVGLNGAGKSVLLESIFTGALAAVHDPIIASLGAARMCFDFQMDGAPVAYSYWRRPNPNIQSDDESAMLWEEHCVDTESKKEFWRVEGEVAYLPDGKQMPMPPENGLLRLKQSPTMQLPPEVSRVRRAVKGIRLVGAGVPRHQPFRTPLILSKFRPDIRVQADRSRMDERVSQTMRQLVSWNESKSDLFNAVVAIGRRLELLEDIAVEINDDNPPPDQPQLPTHTARVFVDRTDFGYLSDGTLRILEIVTHLVDPSTTILLLEEPETAIHPGLLRRVLAEVDAFGCERQVIISTHSPIIVDWARPKDVRIVEREGGRTHVHALGAQDLKDVTAYLEDSLSLSDFLYSRTAE